MSTKTRFRFVENCSRTVLHNFKPARVEPVIGARAASRL
jgi:hypothetical protein